jgi:sortase A
VLSPGSRAALAALLLAAVLVLAGCTGTQERASGPSENASERSGVAGGSDDLQERIEAASEAATPDLENLQGPPEFRDWDDPAAEDYTPETARFFRTGGSAGAIPAVKPFNFGRDPGGPEDKTLYLTVPKIGLENVEVYNSLSEEALTDSAVHVPATGFPWQEGANTYIAGHRLGYPGTGSYRIFYDLDRLEEGDEIILRDAAGNEYTYRVTRTLVTDPYDVEVMNPVEGRNIVTLQTCTLPDYRDRIVVQGEMVEGETIPS